MFDEREDSSPSLLLALSNHCHVLMPAFIGLHCNEASPSSNVPFSSSPTQIPRIRAGRDGLGIFPAEEENLGILFGSSGRSRKSQPRSRQEPFWGGFGDSFSPRARLGLFLVPGKTQIFKFWLYSGAGSNQDRLFLLSPEFGGVGL